MKVITIINYIALAIPILFGLAGLNDEEFFIHALLFTALTGAIQVILALIMLFKYPSNLLYIYSGITVFFFLLWMALGSDQFYIFALPPALALLLTYIIITKNLKEQALLKL